MEDHLTTARKIKQRQIAHHKNDQTGVVRLGQVASEQGAAPVARITV